MAKHYSTSLSEGVLDTFNFKVGDIIPAIVSDAIVPIQPIYRNLDIYSGNVSDSDAATQMVMDNTRPFFIHSIIVNVSKSLAAQASSLRVYYIVGGTTKTLARIGLAVGSNSADNLQFNYPMPLQVPANASLFFKLDDGTASIDAVVVLYGHY